MPTKEIMTLASILMAGWFLTGGQAGVTKNLRATQIRILREVTRTDNWGNPSIFPLQFPKAKKTACTKLRLRR